MSNSLFAVCLALGLSACGGAASQQSRLPTDAAQSSRGGTGAAAADPVRSDPSAGSTADAGSETDAGASAPAAPGPAADKTVIARAPGDHAEAPLCEVEGPTDLVQLDGDRIRLLDKLNYRIGEAAPLPESLRLLDQLARVLCAEPAMRVEVGVHTDSRGSSRYNLALSEKRAAAVRAHLAGRGVAPQRVRAKGYGETVPITHNPTRHERRTEIKVLTP